MKFEKHSLALLSLLLFSALTFLGGCATTGMDRSVNTSNSIKDVDSEIRKMIIQIDATSASLDALVVAGNPDLKNSFDSYTDNVTRLDSEGKRVIKRTDEMKAQSKEYFSEWEKQGDAFSNEEIRELSSERRNKLADIYARVPAASAGIKATYHDYLTDLKEIQKYLSTDLTPKGVEAIVPVAKKSVKNLVALKASLRPVIEALDDIKAELYKGKK